MAYCGVRDHDQTSHLSQQVKLLFNEDHFPDALRGRTTDKIGIRT